MRLPNFSGDAQTAKMFQLIDEQLSELYSQHGEMQSRKNIETQNDVTVGRNLNVTNAIQITGGRPEITQEVLRNSIYPNSVVVGWGVTDSSGDLVNGFNVSASGNVFTFNTQLTGACTVVASCAWGTRVGAVPPPPPFHIFVQPRWAAVQSVSLTGFSVNVYELQTSAGADFESNPTPVVYPDFQIVGASDLSVYAVAIGG